MVGFAGLFGGAHVAAGDTPRADAKRLGIGERVVGRLRAAWVGNQQN